MNKTNKIIFGVATTTVVVATGVGLLGLGNDVEKQSKLKARLNPNQEELFAQIDKEGNVLRTLVISQEMIETGKWGDPSTFVPARQQGRKDYASKGYKIDLENGYIISKKPNNHAALNPTTGEWISPARDVRASSTQK